MEYPKLRPLEAFPVENNMICIRDPLNFSDKMLLLPPDIFFICALFDGRHSILDIQAEYTRRYGDLIFSARINKIIEQMDECLFLENSRFHEVRKNVIEGFKNSGIRPATHAGISYEEKPDKLTQQLEDIFKQSGCSDFSRGFGVNDGNNQNLTGLVAPHIDLRRGGTCYAWAYSELQRKSRSQTFVILGISHSLTKTRFVLTDKDFDTPLGIIKTDKDFVRRLAGLCTTDFFLDEFAHRNEHSIEFQTLFLQYLFGGKKNFRIVPVLCAAIPLSGSSDEDNQTAAEVNEFLSALKNVILEYGSEICCIAGVDLSHMGRRFGQELTLSESFLRWAEEEDRKMLQPVLDLDAEKFLDFIKKEKDKRNVCGVPAIYSLLKILQSGGFSSSSRLLKYGRAVDPATQSVVTFAAAGFYNAS
ncbi:MAG: AmmeMemoRadiSam system protein B [Spirochaetota bacterium]